MRYREELHNQFMAARFVNRFAHLESELHCRIDHGIPPQSLGLVLYDHFDSALPRPGYPPKSSGRSANILADIMWIDATRLPASLKHLFYEIRTHLAIRYDPTTRTKARQEKYDKYIAHKESGRYPEEALEWLRDSLKSLIQFKNMEKPSWFYDLLRSAANDSQASIPRVVQEYVPVEEKRGRMVTGSKIVMPKGLDYCDPSGEPPQKKQKTEGNR